MTTTASNIISSSKKPLITSVSCHRFGNLKENRAVTDEVTAQRHLSPGSGRWTQNKINPERLKPANSAFNAVVRQWEKDCPIAWGKGQRLCYPAKYDAMRAKLNSAIGDAMDVVDETIVAHWHDIVEEAREMHNGDFDPELYPSQSQIRGKFSIDVEVMPMPDASHFDSELQGVFGPQLEALVNRRMKAAELEAWSLIIKPLAHMGSTLANPKAIFRDSLVGNVRDIMNAIPEINFSGSPELAAARNELATFANLNPDDLRNMPEIRDTAAKAAQAMAAKYSAAKRHLELDA